MKRENISKKGTEMNDLYVILFLLLLVGLSVGIVKGLERLMEK
jgi:hypothetical protein